MRQVVFLAIVPLLAATGVAAQSLDAYQPQPIVPPTSMAAQADGKIIIVGNFNRVGTSTLTGVARLDVDGSVDPTFHDPAANSEVKTVAIDRDGSLLIGGGFTSVGGQPRHGLARLHADGSLDTSFADPGFNDTVWAIAVQADGRIFVGGSFTMIGTHAQNYLARISTSGDFDATFADPGLCCNPLVNAIALENDGHVLIGGAFSQAGGENDHFYLARFSDTGVFDPTFPATTASIMPASIVIAPDGSIYIGNNGTDSVVKLTAGGAVASSFSGATTDGSIDSFALQPNGKIVIGGTFQNVGGQPHHALARLNADGSPDASFADLNFSFNVVDANGYIYGVVEQADGRIVAIGNFTLASGQPRQYMARVETGDYATNALVVQPNGASVDVTWYRLGDGPELITPPTLLHSSDCVDFTVAGPMTSTGNGWRASAGYDVHGAPFCLQVMGTTGQGNDSQAQGHVASEIYSSDTIFSDGFE